MPLRRCATTKDAIERVIELGTPAPPSISKATSTPGSVDLVGTRPMTHMHVAAGSGSMSIGDGETLTLTAGTNVTITRTGNTVSIAAATGMAHFHVAGTAGTTQEIGDNDTLSILGSMSINTIASATDTLTVYTTGRGCGLTNVGINTNLGTDYHIVASNTASNIDFTLPEATGDNVGRIYYLIAPTAGTVRVLTYSGSDYINGVSSYTIASATGIIVVCYATHYWHIVGTT